MNRVWLLVIVILVLAGVGYYFMKGNQTTYPPNQTTTGTDETAAPLPGMENTIQLAEQNGSSESGTAILTEKDGKVTVALRVIGAPSDVPQPAHIHVGKCPDVGAVAYPLTDVVNGVSQTTLDVTLSQLAAKLPLGINVHKSLPEVKVYVACGDLAIKETSTAPSTGGTNSNY